MAMTIRSMVVMATLALATVGAGGCVRRVVTITSDPSGATVWLNDRELGRTPVEAEFTYYGTYDVRLQKDGYEPLDTSADAKSPWWDTIGVDFAAELVPAQLKSENLWHFPLEPASTDTDALLQRAKALRDR
ncbi:MAG: PEGA domain-containing protein [Phycisphaerae bacterium]|nr:PEGA domain-containing protein [Phycisphaerae bacterium]